MDAIKRVHVKYATVDCIPSEEDIHKVGWMSIYQPLCQNEIIPAVMSRLKRVNDVDFVFRVGSSNFSEIDFRQAYQDVADNDTIYVFAVQNNFLGSFQHTSFPHGIGMCNDAAYLTHESMQPPRVIRSKVKSRNKEPDGNRDKGVWTEDELLVLNTAKREEREKYAGARDKTKKAADKWNDIAAYCQRNGVNRDSLQCEKRWDFILRNYKIINDYEKAVPVGQSSYWQMPMSERRYRELPSNFSLRLYEAMEAWLGRRATANSGVVMLEMPQPSTPSPANLENGDANSPLSCLGPENKGKKRKLLPRNWEGNLPVVERLDEENLESMRLALDASEKDRAVQVEVNAAIAGAMNSFADSFRELTTMFKSQKNGLPLDEG